MAHEIIMPRLSDSMEEGTILEWLVAEGDRVEVGQPLVEIETDKATVTYEADTAGVILTLSAAAGATVPLGAAIAVIGEPDEQLGTLPAGERVSAGEPGSTTGEPGAAAVEPGAAGTSANQFRIPVPDRKTSPAPMARTDTTEPSEARPKASPVARRLAAERGVDLAGLAGSGPNGRVTRADVERAATPPAPAPAAATPAAPAPAAATPAAPAPAAASAPATPGKVTTAKGDAQVHELSRIQRTVGRRMAESRATVPDFELRCEVNMAEVVELRERLREVTQPLPSYNDFIVKAVALALREFPRANGSYRDDTVQTYSRINVGVAVAADEALVVPTIFDADRMSIGEISRQGRELAAKVRDGTIGPADLGGATFTVSNLGMYGVDSFSAVINPPQAAILAVGSLKQRAVVDEEGNLVARPTIILTLACDHRVLYGADGARFLARVRELLERPQALML